RRRDRARRARARPSLEAELLVEEARELADVDSHLRGAVALPDRNRSGAQRVAVHRDAKRRSGLILAPITAPDRAFLVVEHVVAPLEAAIDLERLLRHPVLLDEREHRRLDRGEARMQPENRPRLAAEL